MTARLNAANNASSVLSGAISAAATSLIVSDASSFPAVPFVISIDDEIILVEAKAGTTFSSLTRGYESTTAAAHANAAAVEGRWTAGMYNQLTAHLADTVHVGAVGFAVGSTSDPTTTSTSYVDLVDMSVTLTTKGGDLLVFLVGEFKSTNLGEAVSIALKLDSGSSGYGVMGANQMVANYIFPLYTVWRFTGVAAGSHTVLGQWQVTAGTATANATHRQMLVMEVKAPC